MRDPQPWQVGLVVKVNDSCSIYMIPRHIARDLLRELKDYKNTALNVIPSPKLKSNSKL